MAVPHNPVKDLQSDLLRSSPGLRMLVSCVESKPRCAEVRLPRLHEVPAQRPPRVSFRVQIFPRVPCLGSSVNWYESTREWREDGKSPSPVNRLNCLVMDRLIKRTDCEMIWRPSIGASHGRRDQRIARRFLSHKLTQEVQGRVSIDQIHHASIIPCAR